MDKSYEASESVAFFQDCSDFLENFEPDFVRHFALLCLGYEKSLDEIRARETAHLIYANLFEGDQQIKDMECGFLQDMFRNGIMVDAILSRSLFFLAENFFKHVKNADKSLYQYSEFLIKTISHFLVVFESEIYKTVPSEPIIFSSEPQEAYLHNNIVDIFRTIKSQNQSVEFLNVYQGVSISNDAQIVDIDDGEVVFRVSEVQGLAMKLEGKAYIMKNDYFQKHIKADVVYNNFSNKTVVLNNFVYLLNMPTTQRESMRVHPEVSAKVVMLSDKSKQTIGRLYDISRHGLGVISESNNGIFLKERVEVEFDIDFFASNTSLKTMHLKGEVINIIQYGTSYRYCMKIFPDDIQAREIDIYTARREIEIVQGLKDKIQDYLS
ncbi:MAG: PilZ domain-containing protein [Sulfurospirillaceae bacterium]|nr:PilZ domain-containing protein [Sulfurospirillaceae bacterium]